MYRYDRVDLGREVSWSYQEDLFLKGQKNYCFKKGVFLYKG